MARATPQVSLAGAAAALVGAVGACVLLGYTFGLPVLVSVAPGLPAMAVPTAAGMLVLAVAIAAETAGWILASSALAWISIGVGAGSGVLHLAFGRDVVGPLLARQIFGFDGRHSGQVSLATSACLVLISASVLLRFWSLEADLTAAASLLLSGTAFLCFAYGLHDLHSFWLLDPMSVQTAVSLTVLGFAALFARPERGMARLLGSPGAGAAVLRRQIAFIVLVPALTGAVLARLPVADGIGPAGAMALLVTFSAAPLAVLAVRDRASRASADTKRDAEVETLRQLAEKRGQALATNEVRYRAFFNASPQFLVLLRLTEDGELRYEDINPTVEAAYDMSRADVIGRLPSDIVAGETADSIETHARECLRTRTMLEYDSALVLKTGSRTPLRVVCAPVDLGAGRPVYVLFSGRDVSRQRDAEEELRALRERYERRDVTRAV